MALDFGKIDGEKIIVGAHPRGKADIENLFENYGVKAIEDLQQSEEQNRGNITEITEECKRLVIWYQHVPMRDGDAEKGPESVRARLPVAVGILNRAITEKAQKDGETVYLHCCAGDGRSPSVAVAYLYWFKDKTFAAARNLVTLARIHSNPFDVSIREATNYILQQCGRDAVNGEISSTDRLSITYYVTHRLPEVLNA